MKGQPGSKWARSLSVSAANQVLLSGTGFAFNVYLVRWLGGHEFGVFGICFTAMLFLTGMVAALLLEQMTVNVPERPDGTSRALYLASMGVLVALFGMVMVGVAATAAAVGAYVLPSPNYSLLCLIAVSGSGFIVREFFVRCAYIDRHERRALLSNAVTASTLLGLVVLQDTADSAGTAARALGIYAASQFAGAFAGAALTPMPWRAVKRALLAAHLEEAWQGGRWSVPGTIVYWIRSQIHIVAASLLAGPSAVAALNAARLLATPAVVLLPAVSQIVLPRLAERRNDLSALMRLGASATLGVVAMALAYLTILEFWLDEASAIVLGDRFGDLSSLVLAWCAYSVSLGVMTIATQMLLAQRRFRDVLERGALTVLLTVACVPVLWTWYGLIGVVIAMVVADLLMGGLCWRALGRGNPRR